MKDDVAQHRAQANPLTWAVEAAARKGDVVSGDASVVCPEREGTLFAVIDGVGHGAAAAHASNVAADTIRSIEHTDLRPWLVSPTTRSVIAAEPRTSSVTSTNAATG